MMAKAPPGGGSRTCPLHGHGLLKVAITVAFVFSLTLLLLHSKSGGWVFSEESKMVIGSKPPACVNKCMNCRPCMATVVVPSPNNHQSKRRFKFQVPSHSHDEDDTYYLLSWKCRCGDKLFQP